MFIQVYSFFSRFVVRFAYFASCVIAIYNVDVFNTCLHR